MPSLKTFFLINLQFDKLLCLHVLKHHVIFCDLCQVIVKMSAIYVFLFLFSDFWINYPTYFGPLIIPISDFQLKESLVVKNFIS